jgi:hypothetical protein
MDEKNKQICVVMVVYWCLYKLIQQVMNIQALVVGHYIEKFALFVVMCEFMWRKKQIVYAFKNNMGL